MAAVARKQRIAEKPGRAPRRLTREQDLALQTRDVSVALSAGAGCGKTFVLTERYLAHFDPRDPDAFQPEDIDQIVAITFTDRAAREMRDRIREKCYERLMAASDADAPYWVELLRNLDAARISTIHSFCTALLRSHAVEAQIDPRFQVLEQIHAEALLAEVIDDVFRERLAARDESCLELVVRFGLEHLRELVTVLALRRDRAAFQTWLARTPHDLVKAWTTFFEQGAVPAALTAIATCAAAQRVLQILSAVSPSHPIMRERCEELCTTLREWQASAPHERDVARLLSSLRDCTMLQGRGGKGAWPSAEDYDEFKTAVVKLRDKIDEVSKCLRFDGETAVQAATSGLQILHVASEVADRYDARKGELGVLDFHDLVARASALLTAPAHSSLREAMSSRLQLLLVDEFQDTDPVQADLVRALCGGGVESGRLFFVGDHKQSIYRFRGAAPEVFRDLQTQTPKDGRLRLSQNFRSQPAILDFVNALFRDELGCDYEELHAQRKQLNRGATIEFLWAPNEEPKESKESMRRREADWIARRLRSMIDGDEKTVVDSATGKLRPARPGDIALLFRALSDVRYYEEALDRYEIDYYLVGGHAFYAQQEIYDLLNLLRAIENPADGVSLSGVLRSPLFSLNDETLFWLAQHRHGLAAAVRDAVLPDELQGIDRQRAQAAIETLAALRSRKDRLSVTALINEALDRTGYDALLVAEFLGPRKLANLRKLLQQARTLDRAGIFSLSDFITQLADFVVREPDEALAATHPEATDVVRLMTVHQAKGLEFPIVVVPDLDRPQFARGTGVAFTPELGPVVKMPPNADGTQCAAGYEMFQLVEGEKDSQERNRLLYVAMTRAADFLILSSAVPSVGAAGGPWLRLIARHFNLTSGTYCHDHGAAPIPKVRVITERPRIEGLFQAGRRTTNLKTIIDQIAAMASDEPPLAPRLSQPVPVDFAARRQYSFSRLAGNLYVPARATVDDDLVEPAAPRDPLGLGSLVHAALADERLSLQCDVRQLVRRHAAKQSQAMRAGIAETDVDEAVEMLERFLASELGGQIAAAEPSYCEIEFLMRWPLGDTGDSRHSFSGFIDRLYRDASGNWHLVDFKTNRVTHANVAEVAAGYEMQLLLYGLAARQVLGVAPETLRLYFLRGGLEYRFMLDAGAERRLQTLIDAAIARLSVGPALPLPG